MKTLDGVESVAVDVGAVGRKCSTTRQSSEVLKCGYRWGYEVGLYNCKNLSGRFFNIIFFFNDIEGGGGYLAAVELLPPAFADGGLLMRRL